MSQQDTFDLDTEQKTGPVECLGKTFENDEQRREHYTELLREKLKDPEFRKIEGFPIGEDEDILALSDPPYYTACPNPWIGDFVTQYGRPYDPKEKYHREPFAADVSEGKNHPIYNAHSYHTKVPHRAIMRYILHYTEPGDIVFDGFCGTGMTGVAAQLCGDRNEVQELGYRVDSRDVIYNEEGNAFSKLGARRAVLNDLSPAATYIANAYNTNFDADSFKQEALNILKKATDKYGWFYETKTGTINYTIWSDVLLCPNCQEEIVYIKEAYKTKEGVAASFNCPSCGFETNKSNADKRFESITTFDGKIKQRIKRVPSFVDAKENGTRLKRELYESDRNTIERIETIKLPTTIPNIPFNKESEQYKRDALHLRAIETASDFYTRRNLLALAELKELSRYCTSNKAAIELWISSIQWLSTLMYRFREGGGGGQQGKLTIPSLICEQNVFKLAKEKIKDIAQIGQSLRTISCRPIISTADAANFSSTTVSRLDYSFIDPPFGGNIFYSDLNFIWESWARVITNDKTEAVVHRVQKKSAKSLKDYSSLMSNGFEYIMKALKPGRWVTTEFSNSKASIWNGIQNAIQSNGFVIANVAALDKKQRSFRSVTSTTAVKQDLVISAYKPNGGLEERFEKHGDSIEGVWDFLNTHLKNLPVVKAHGVQLDFIAERDPRILHDRMVAFYVGHYTDVPLSSGEFQAEVYERYPMRDEMVFLPEQVAEYDKKRAKMENIGQMSIFVEDEKSAIAWLRNMLKERPSNYQEFSQDFMQQLSASWKKFETRPELSVLLDQNFIRYDGSGEVPSQIHSYLSTNHKDMRGREKTDPVLIAKAKDRWFVPDPKKAADVDALREKRLLQEFWQYLPDGYAASSRNKSDSKQQSLGIPSAEAKRAKKKFKEVRSEAVRVGFKHCFQQKDYATILAVASGLPSNVIEEDEQLQMIYDVAEARAS